MRPFRSTDAGLLTAEFEPVEAALLTQLAGQVAGLLTAESTESGGRDPVIARLVPDAYRDDADAAAEFRRFTAHELVDAKVQNAQAVIADVSVAMVADAPTEVTLDPAAVQSWVRALTDIRLVLATRLGIGDDGMPDTDADAVFMLGDVYDWLGWVQDSLVTALDES